MTLLTPKTRLLEIAGAFLLVFSSGSFLFTLDRYPAFEGDEPFFNISPARFVEGRSFAYVMHPQAPQAGQLLETHGPFFSRLQIAMFKVFGVSHLTCRLPSYLGAHAGILLLWFFLKRRWPITAAILAIVWVGDRSRMEIMLGRPDGLSFFMLSCAFVSSCMCWQAARGGCGVRRFTLLSVLSSVCYALAAGFHPLAALFGVAATSLCVCFLPSVNRLRYAVATAAGVALILGLVTLCWLPNLADSVRQFWWFAQVNEQYTPSFLANWIGSLRLWPTRNWAQVWQSALIFIVPIVVLPLAVLTVFRIRKSVVPKEKAIIPLMASVFSVAGFMLLMQTMKGPYYFLYFTIWPVIALASYWEARIVRKAGALGLAVSGVALTIAWTPSLAWNALRSREVVVQYRALDKRPMIDEIKKHIPAGSIVWGSPKYFVVIAEAGYLFEPLPYYGVVDLPWRLPENCWAVISEGDESCLNSRLPEELQYRVVLHLTAFASSPYTVHGYLIVAPKGIRRLKE